MNPHTDQSTEETEGTYIRLPVPLGDPSAFRYGATADVLHRLIERILIGSHHPCQRIILLVST